MLKIKSNTNEFTIIFLRRLERKRMLKRSRSASVQFNTPSSFLLLFFLFQHLFFFLLLFSAPLFFSFQHLLLFLFFLPFFSFQFTCALFFSPKTFFSTQNNSLFSPKTFFSAQNLFAIAQNLFHSFLLLSFFFSFNASSFSFL